jgi:hypothetical protein
VKAYRILIFLGFGLYVASFFLTGVNNASDPAGVGGIPGYGCAWLTLVSPWGSEGLKALHDSPGDFFSVLISGLINPIFLITVSVLLVRPNGRLGLILRVLLLLMFPTCWIVFFRAHLHARAGYYLWTAAMFLIMFSTVLARTPTPAVSQKPIDKRSNIS